MNRIKIIYLFLIVTLLSFKQEPNTDKSYEDFTQLRLTVLKEKDIGKEYCYDYTGRNTCNKTIVKYLGRVSTVKNKDYQIITSFYVHGSSCRGTSRINIYDDNDKYLGNYYVSMPYLLPDTIINNQLAYSKNNKGCNKIHSISFKNGLPKTIFIKCKDGIDSYAFSNEE